MREAERVGFAVSSEVGQRFRVALYSAAITSRLSDPSGADDAPAPVIAGSVIVVDFEQQYGEGAIEHKIVGARQYSSRVTAMALSGCGQWLAVQTEYRHTEIHPLPSSKCEAVDEAAARMEPIEEDNELPDVSADIAAIPPCAFAIMTESGDAERVLSSLPQSALPDPALYFVPTQPKLTLAYPLAPQPPAVIENIVAIPPLAQRWQVYRCVVWLDVLLGVTACEALTARTVCLPRLVPSTRQSQPTQPRLLKDFSLAAAASARCAMIKTQTRGNRWQRRL